MANKALIWLIKDGLNAITSQNEKPKFDFNYMCPIYDQMTDYTTREEVQENPGQAISDKAHVLETYADVPEAWFVRRPNWQYKLEEFGENGWWTINAAGKEGNKGNPPWSQYISENGTIRGLMVGKPCSEASTQYEDGYATYYGSVDTEGQFNYDSSGYRGNPTSWPSSWDSSWLYNSVITASTGEGSETYGEGYCVWTVNMTTTNGASDGKLISGAIRFNKVLVFNGSVGALKPVALICFPNAVSIAPSTNSTGIASTFSFSFGLKFDPETYDVVEASVSKDNWNVVSGTSDPVPPIYRNGKIKVSDGLASVGTSFVGMINVEQDTKYKIKSKPVVHSVGSTFGGSGGATGRVLNVYNDGFISIPTNSNYAISSGRFGGVGIFYSSTDHVIGRVEGSFVIRGFTGGDDRFVSSLVIQHSDLREMYTKKTEISAVIGNDPFNTHYSVVVGGVNEDENVNPKTYNAELHSSLIVGEHLLKRYPSDMGSHPIGYKSPIVILGHNNYIVETQTEHFDYALSACVIGMDNRVEYARGNKVVEFGYDEDDENVRGYVSRSRFVLGNGLTAHEATTANDVKDWFVLGDRFRSVWYPVAGTQEYTVRREDADVPILSISVTRPETWMDKTITVFKLPIHDDSYDEQQNTRTSGMDIPVISRTDGSESYEIGTVCRMNKGLLKSSLTGLEYIQQCAAAGYMPLMVYIGNKKVS